MLGITWDLKLSDLPKRDANSTIHFFLVPLAGLWDTSKADEKTPNDYGIIRLSFSGEIKKFGFRLLYKDEPELEATRKNRYDDTEHLVSGCFVFENLQQKVEAPVNSETFQLFPQAQDFSLNIGAIFIFVPS